MGRLATFHQRHTARRPRATGCARGVSPRDGRRGRRSDALRAPRRLNSQPSTFHSHEPRILTTTIALLLTARAFAVTETWDGNSPNAGAGDSNLSTGLNWVDNSAPVSDILLTDLIFAGTTKLTPNVSAALSVNSVTFNNTSGAFTFAGTALTIGNGGITNNDTNTMTFTNVASFINAATPTINAASGGLTFTNAVTLQSAALTVDGNAATSFFSISGVTNASLTKQGAGAMSWAQPPGTTSFAVTVNAGSLNTVADGNTDIFDGGGNIAVNGTATLNIGESLTLDNVQLTRATGATLTLVAGKTLTIENGADAIITGAFTNATASTIVVTNPGSTFSTTSPLGINGGSTMTVSAAGAASSGAGSVSIGTSGNGTATVSNSASFTGGNLNVGTNGNTGSLTFSGSSTGTFGGISLGTTLAGLSSGTLLVQSGSTVNALNLAMATSAVLSTGTVTITGANSALTITGAASSTIGAAAVSTATLNVQSGGTFTGGTGSFTVGVTGTVAIAGGTFNANGSTTVSGLLTRDATGVFTLAPGKTLTMQIGGDALFTGSYATGTTTTNGGNITATGVGSTFQTSGALTVASGSALNALSGGSVSSLNSLNVGTNGAGALTVDGAGSSASSGSASTWGAGSAATVTFANGATGSFVGSLALAASSLGGTSAAVSILSGATVTSGALNMATAGGGSSASLTIDGAGSAMTLNGTSTFNLGFTNLAPATLTLQNGGTFNSGTGNATITPTGSIAINGGIYNANGNLTLSGGQLTRNGAGTLTLAQDKTLTVQGGGDAVISGQFQQLNRANLNVTGAGSTFTTTGDFQWEGGNSTLALVTVQGGGLLSTAGALHLARTNSAVSMTVSGAGSQVIASPLFTSEWQAGVLMTTGASATLGGLRIADVNFGSSSFASLTVQSGSTVLLGNLAVATQAAIATGELTVEGAGSAVTQTGSSSLGLGASFASSATLSVNNSGTFTSGTGAFTLNATGTLNIDAGTATFHGPLTYNGGVVNFTAGALLFTNPTVNLTVGTGGMLGTNLTLTSAQRLQIGGTTTVDAFRTLTLNGGTFTTGALVNNGTIAFNSGTLAITGAGGFTIGTGAALGASVVLGTGANLNVTNTATIATDGSLTLNGGRLDAGILSNSGSLRLDVGTVSVSGVATNTSVGQMFLSDTFSTAGTLTNSLGGRVTLRDGAGRLSGVGALSNSGLITGDGTIAKALTNTATGEIRAETGKFLVLTGANAANAGKYNLLGGELDFTQAQTNSASGQINGHGTLNFAAGLTNSGTMNFSGGLADVFGTVNLLAGSKLITTGGGISTFYGAVTHNATEVRTSAGAQTVFFGLVNGAGPFTGTGTVFFEGGYSPGNSPASVLHEGDLFFGGASTLTMELGGLLLGGQYDHLNVGGTFTADGALDVLLYGGFAPHFGDTFDLFDAGALAGNFDDVNLPALSGGLTWDDSQLSTNGQLRVVPEPSAALLGLIGAAAAFARRRNNETLTRGGDAR